jgi:hypothetical protein
MPLTDRTVIMEEELDEDYEPTQDGKLFMISLNYISK